jgi:hypothetical protein
MGGRESSPGPRVAPRVARFASSVARCNLESGIGKCLEVGLFWQQARLATRKIGCDDKDAESPCSLFMDYLLFDRDLKLEPGQTLVGAVTEVRWSESDDRPKTDDISCA